MSRTTLRPYSFAMRIALRDIASRFGFGEVGAGDQHCPGRADVVGIDVVLGQRGVGAILAEEDEREGLLVADAEG